MMPSPKEFDEFDALVYRSTPGAPTVKVTDDADKINGDDWLKKNKSRGRHALPTTAMPSSYLARKGNNTKLPPKLVIKFFIHEEVSSIQEMKSNNIDHISCHVNLEGSIYAQIISSSNATNNPPFAVRLSDPDYPEDNYQFETNFMNYYGSGEFNTLTIPKAVLGRIKVASYQRSVTKKFMPVLVQSKVVRTGAHLEKCQLAIQVRSNLKNKGSVKDLVVCCAIPPAVIAKSLKITQGENGTFDEFKRIIQWNVKELAVGKSIIFSAELDVCLKNILVDDVPKIPVLIRCSSSADIVSSVEVDVREINGHPSQIVALRHHSFRLLHRLPS